ncbi:MAG: phospholipase D-like domain-containing protein [bacterium]
MSNIKKITKWISLITILSLIILTAVFHFTQILSLPSGVHICKTSPISENEIRLLLDTTAFNPKTNKRVIHQENFKEILFLIKRAKDFIYLDFFLWNNFQGSTSEDYRKVSLELATALINKKKTHPKIKILVLTDPINRIYGKMEPQFFHHLVDAGIVVVFTDLSYLVDSHLIYSIPGQIINEYLSKVPLLKRLLEKPIFPNLINQDSSKISLKQLSQILFFKANHRKLIIANTLDNQWKMIVTSFNPSDSSSAHSNCGLLVSGKIVKIALSAELAGIEWSAKNPKNILNNKQGEVNKLLFYLRNYIERESFKQKTFQQKRKTTVTWLTEGAIKDRLLEMLDKTKKKDEVRIAMFYLSDRRVIQGIKKAVLRGANVRIILDANRDAFGHTKNGIPNRPVAAELIRLKKIGKTNISIRWADTRGEQFHHKAICIVNLITQKYQFMCGSANWTRRNIADLNLEANLLVEGAPEVSKRFIEYFDRAWNNKDGLNYTVDYNTVAEKGWNLWWKTFIYYLQEKTGTSTF